MAMAEDEFRGRNVRVEQNKSISKILGKDRRRDVSVWDADTGELLKVYEAARVDARGNFVPREQQKMAEYWEYGIPHYFREVK